jgi:hypothetical protein
MVINLSRQSVGHSKGDNRSTSSKSSGSLHDVGILVVVILLSADTQNGCFHAGSETEVHVIFVCFSRLEPASCKEFDTIAVFSGTVVIFIGNAKLLWEIDSCLLVAHPVSCGEPCLEFFRGLGFFVVVAIVISVIFIGIFVHRVFHFCIFITIGGLCSCVTSSDLGHLFFCELPVSSSVDGILTIDRSSDGTDAEITSGVFVLEAEACHLGAISKRGTLFEAVVVEGHVSVNVDCNNVTENVVDPVEGVSSLESEGEVVADLAVGCHVVHGHFKN